MEMLLTFTISAVLGFGKMAFFDIAIEDLI